MKFSEFFRNNRFASIISVIIVLAIIAFLSFLLSSVSKQAVPSDFTDARVAASGYAAEIVSFLDSTNEKISEVKKLVEIYKYNKALGIVSEEIDKNKDIREKAVRLALELEKMAKSIPDIESSEAAQIALVATSKETGLIAKLLSYTNELNDLLVALRLVVSSSHPNYKSVNESISRVNDAAEEINILNEEYKKEMENFDTIVNGGDIVTPSYFPTSSPTSIGS